MARSPEATTMSITALIITVLPIMLIPAALTSRTPTVLILRHAGKP